MDRDQLVRALLKTFPGIQMLYRLIQPGGLHACGLCGTSTVMATHDGVPVHARCMEELYG